MNLAFLAILLVVSAPKPAVAAITATIVMILMFLKGSKQ
jgi:hypothetical protein